MMCHVNKNNQKAGLPRRFAPRNDLPAFTLAEVLITLGIIGVVAAMTMPVLIQNHQEKVTVTRLKKAYSILSQAYMSSSAENIDIIITHQIMDFHIGSVRGSQCHGSV